MLVDDPLPVRAKPRGFDAFTKHDPTLFADLEKPQILTFLEVPPGRVYALPDTPEAPPVVIHDIEITTEPEDNDR